jgi:Polyketide cyclase / dehydrase and lipid transport
LGTTRVTIAVTVHVAPEVLWDELSALERHVDWMRDARSIQFVGPSRRGVGTRFVCDTRVGPLRTRDTMTVTDWDPPRLLGIRHEGLVGGHGQMRLRPLDRAGATELVWDETLWFPWWLGGALAGRAAAPVLRRLWQGNLAALRRRVEAAPSSPLPGR